MKKKSRHARVNVDFFDWAKEVQLKAKIRTFNELTKNITKCRALQLLEQELMQYEFGVYGRKKKRSNK